MNHGRPLGARLVHRRGQQGRSRRAKTRPSPPSLCPTRLLQVSRSPGREGRPPCVGRTPWRARWISGPVPTGVRRGRAPKRGAVTAIDPKTASDAPWPARRGAKTGAVQTTRPGVATVRAPLLAAITVVARTGVDHGSAKRRGVKTAACPESALPVQALLRARCPPYL